MKIPSLPPLLWPCDSRHVASTARRDEPLYLSESVSSRLSGHIVDRMRRLAISNPMTYYTTDETVAGRYLLNGDDCYDVLEGTEDLSALYICICDSMGPCT